MQQTTTPSTKNKWLIMAAVATGIFLATIDGSIVNIALPTLKTELSADFAIIQWVVLAYLLTITTLMLGIGRLGDMIGKKTLYTAGFIIFTIGSGLCGLSQTAAMLIFCRVLQACGAAMVMALGTAIVTEAFPPQERGKALGITGLMVSLGSITGPTIGGLILGILSWHWIFFVNLPLGIIGIIMVIRYVPASQPAGRQRFDFSGAAALFVALLALLMALTLGETSGFVSPLVLGLFALTFGAAAFFIWLERRTSHPIIDLSLFKNRLFSVNLITGFMTFVASAGIVLLMPFFLQDMLGYSPQISGMMMAIVPLSMGITAPLSGSLSDRWGTRPLTVAGLAVLLVGYLAVSQLNLSTTPFVYMLSYLPVGVGMGLFQSPNNSAIMGSAPRQRLGVVSGLLSLTRTLGQTSGIAVMGAVWTSLTLVNASAAFTGESSAAPVAARMAALQQTAAVVVVIIAIALSLSVWALLSEKRIRQEPFYLNTTGK